MKALKRTINPRGEMEEQPVRTTWKRKRTLAARAGDACRSGTGTVSPCASQCPALRIVAAVDPEPGPSHSVDSTVPPTSLTDESSASESESENERGESSSDDETVFGEEQAQEVFDDLW